MGGPGFYGPGGATPAERGEKLNRKIPKYTVPPCATRITQGKKEHPRRTIGPEENHREKP